MTKEGWRWHIPKRGNEYYVHPKKPDQARCEGKLLLRSGVYYAFLETELGSYPHWQQEEDRNRREAGLAPLYGKFHPVPSVNREFGMKDNPDFYKSVFLPSADDQVCLQ